MKFNFKIQQYQTDAVEAVVNVFYGQGFHKNSNYIRDLGTLERPINSQVTLSDDDDDIYSDTGFKNENIQLTDEQLLNNIHKQQNANNIKLSPSLVRNMGRCSLDVEMEKPTFT